MPLIHPEHLDQLAVREMPEPKILISDLNVYYGNFHALKNVSLPIPKGCVTAFIGPSGCGKSTLLRSLTRMQDLYPENAVRYPLKQLRLKEHPLQRVQAHLHQNGLTVPFRKESPHRQGSAFFLLPVCVRHIPVQSSFILCLLYN